MASQFDPYHRWLGIPPEEQPPHAYRLLGIKAFESDPDVIASAADRQMAHLRNQQTGPHGDLSQKLLNEVAAARVALLNPSKKAGYDEGLRARLSAQSRPRVLRAQPLDAVVAAPPPAVPAATPVRPSPVPEARPIAQPPEPTPAVPMIHVDDSVGASQRSSSLLSAILLTVLIAGLTALGVMVLSPGRGPGPEGGLVSGDEVALQQPSGTSSEAAQVAKDAEPAAKAAPPIASADPSSQAAEKSPPTVEDRPTTPPSPPDQQAQERRPGEAARPAEPEQIEPQRLAIPTASDQAAVDKQIEEIYDFAAAKTAAAKSRLAHELWKLAERIDAQPAERFVLLRRAADLAAESGETELIFRAVDKVAGEFQVDPLTAKTKLLAKMDTDAAPIDTVMSAAGRLTDEAVKARRFEAALELISLALDLCRRPQGLKYRKELLQRQEEIQALRDGQRKIDEALAAVKSNPADEAANLLLGQHFCFVEGDWPRGMPYLAAGSDAELAAAARQDLETASDEPKDRIEAADRWWDLAEKREDRERKALLLRAGYWYRKAEANVPSAGLTRAKVEKRLKDIDRVCGLAAVSRSLPPDGGVNDMSISTTLPPGAAIPSGKWVEVLDWIEPQRDTVEGQWKREAAGLVVEAGNYSRLMLPVRVDGNYELEVEFVRQEGNDAVALLLPLGTAQCAAVLSAAGGKVHGLGLIAGRDVTDPTNPVVRRPGILQNDRKITVRAAVRREGNKGMIDLSRDGRILIHDGGALSALALPSHWQLSGWQQPGLGVNQSKVCFQKVRLRVTTGQASVVRAGPVAGFRKPAEAEFTPHFPDPVPPSIRIEDDDQVGQRPWTDAMEGLDVTQDAVQGEWKRAAAGVSVAPDRYGRLMLPIEIDGSYDLEAVFTRTAGEGAVAVICPLGARSVVFVMDITTMKYTGLQMIDGQNASANGTGKQGSLLVNDRRCTAIIHVRRGTGRTQITAEIDGQRVVQWSGREEALDASRFALPRPMRPGLGNYDCAATFHQARVRLIQGKGALLRSNDGSQGK